MNLEFKSQPKDQFPGPSDLYFSFYQRGGMIAWECAREYERLDNLIAIPKEDSKLNARQQKPNT